MKKLLFLVVFVPVAFWCLARYWRPMPFSHVAVGRSLLLFVGDKNVELRLGSPDGRTRLRGVLGRVDDGGAVSAVSSCSGSGDSHVVGCVELTVSETGKGDHLLRLEVSYAEKVDCYTFKWRPHAAPADHHVSVLDCFALDDALWYGGAHVYDARWPINAQKSALQPHVTGDYLSPEWRSNPSYGKYGSLVEPYWLLSSGVGIIVDEKIALSSSFNAAGDGRLCLQGDRSTTAETGGHEVPEVLAYTVCRGGNVAEVHRTMSGMFFPRPHRTPDVRMMRMPIWSTWARYKVDVDQSSVEEMAEQIVYYNFSHRYLIFTIVFWFVWNSLPASLSSAATHYIKI